MRFNLKNILFIFFLLTISFSLCPSGFALFEDKEKIAMQQQSAQTQKEKEDLKKENADLKSKLENVTSDRDNILRQAKVFLADKDAATKKMEELKGSTSQSGVELESLKKENELIKSETTRLKGEMTKDRESFQKEKQVIEQKVGDLEARSNSLAKTMEAFPPEKIEQILANSNRLQEENKTMAERVLSYEKQMEEMRREMKPFELDREELYKLRQENKELQNKFSNSKEVEERDQQLLKENTEYREKVEVLKAQFKDTVPSLAKVSRISQKMMRENADMHYNLGTIFLHNKQYKEAVKEYESVLELRPNDPETHYNLGVLYDDYLKEREKALYHYQKYLSIDPKAPDAKKVESYILSLELEQKVR